MKSAERIRREHDKMQKEAIPGIIAAPCKGKDSLFVWEASVTGPTGSPYEGGKFVLDIRLPNNYPLEPPHIKFRTPILHPNVSFPNGDICLDVLKSHWSPALSLQKVLLSISSLLTDPNFSDPLNAAATWLWQRSRAAYYEQCRAMVQKHAKSDSSAALGGSSMKQKAAQRVGPRAAATKAKAKAKVKAKAMVKANPKAKAKARVQSRASPKGNSGSKRQIKGTRATAA